MLKFKVINWRLEPTPELLAIPEFADIIHAAGRKKDEAVKDLLFAWGMEEGDKQDNPYADLPESTRELNVRRCVYGDQYGGPGERRDKARYEAILLARQAYRDWNDNADQRLMTELENMLDYITDTMRTLRQAPAEARSAKNLKELITAVKDVKTLLVNKDEATKLLKQGMESGKTRGKAGVKPSPLESGRLNSTLMQRQAAAAVTQTADV